MECKKGKRLMITANLFTKIESINMKNKFCTYMTVMLSAEQAGCLHLMYLSGNRINLWCPVLCFKSAFHVWLKKRTLLMDHTIILLLWFKVKLQTVEDEIDFYIVSLILASDSAGWVPQGQKLSSEWFFKAHQDWANRLRTSEETTQG